MKKKTAVVLVMAAGIIASGQAYWSVPYDELSLLEKAFLLRWAIPSVVFGAVAHRYTPLGRISVTGLLAAGYGMATVGRVVVEVIGDSASHNLWPLEVIIALFVGGVAAFVGTLIGPSARSIRTPENTRGENG